MDLAGLYYLTDGLGRDKLYPQYSRYEGKQNRNIFKNFNF